MFGFPDLIGVAFFRLHESQEEEPHILLECDSSVLDAIQKHLKLYKIRRKVSISPCLDLSLWAVVPGEQAGDISRYADRALVLTPDPRAEVMGWRLIIKAGANLPEIIPGSRIENVQDYHRHRYKQGKAMPCLMLCCWIWDKYIYYQGLLIKLHTVILNGGLKSHRGVCWCLTL